MSICLSGVKAKSKSIAVTIIPPSAHPLIKLAQAIPWEELAELVLPDLQETTSKKLVTIGRKLRLRTHLGVYLLQQMLDLTDRETEWQLKDNVVYQIFCGLGVVDKWHAPDHTKIETFRSRLSPETQCKIANHVAELGVKLGFADPSKMDQDSTVQEAGMTYPSDARLLVKMGSICEKVYNFFADKFPEEGVERFSMKKIKTAARDYYFRLKCDVDVKKEKFKDLYYKTFFECCKALELSLARRHIDMMPWNIRRAWEQVKRHGKKYFKDVEHFIFNGTIAAGKAMSFHLGEVACFNKAKEGKDLQFGRQIQLGRIGGNFMIVAPCTTVRMEDKKSVKPMVELHDELFGPGLLESFGADKGYYSNANQNFLSKTKGVAQTGLQKPGQDLGKLSEEERAEKIALANRRAAVEPLIGHIKHKGQLGQSRMKNDKSTVASAYAAVGGFNLRQLIRHQLGKKIKAM